MVGSVGHSHEWGVYDQRWKVFVRGCDQSLGAAVINRIVAWNDRAVHDVGESLLGIYGSSLRYLSYICLTWSSWLIS